MGLRQPFIHRDFVANQGSEDIENGGAAHGAGCVEVGILLGTSTVEIDCHLARRLVDRHTYVDLAAVVERIGESPVG